MFIISDYFIQSLVINGQATKQIRPLFHACLNSSPPYDSRQSACLGNKMHRSSKAAAKIDIHARGGMENSQAACRSVIA
jgi:hypothetical protein